MRKRIVDRSPAKARFVTAEILAVGAVDKSETAVVDRHAVVEQLGMSQDGFDKVVNEFHDDILQYAFVDGDELQVDRGTIDPMPDDIRSRGFQMLLLRTIRGIAYADRRLSASEALLASRAMKHRNIQPFL